MNRIDARFEQLKKEDRKGLITFITAGDPDAEKSMAVLENLSESGADFIELGMPFTDPMADGPAIQASSLRALKEGMTLKKTLEMVQQFRAKNQDTPLILMGYYNPIYTYGVEQFVTDAAQSGVDGLIVVDLPPEEDEELRKPALDQGLSIIRLLTPTSDEKRLPKIVEDANGFLYYVAIAGITGTKSADPEKLAPHIAQIRKHTDLPIAIGFGIKTAEDAKAMVEKAGADAIVVGSALVQTIAEHVNDNDLAKIIGDQIKDLSQGL